MSLTFETVIVACRVLVVFLPTLQTDLLPIGSTGVVSKIVMSGFADYITITAIVRVSTHKSVFILQLGVVSVDPLGARVKGLGLSYSMQQLALVGA